MSATEPVFTPDFWICGYRETKTDGNYECVGHPNHAGTHYLVKLVRKAAEEDA